MSVYQIYILLVVALVLVEVRGQPDPRCNDTLLCGEPDCYCPSDRIPKDYERNEIPQMILFSFNGLVTSKHGELVKELFNRKKRNPNGTPIRATFFLSDDKEKTDYCTVNGLWAYGHEIASFGVNRRGPPERWATASQEDWAEEIDTQKEYIVGNASVPPGSVSGFRSPYLVPGGNEQFEFGVENNYVYDSSIVLPLRKPPVWPYTMDFPIDPVEFPCYKGNCPDGEFPGMWQVPIQPLRDLKGKPCNYLNECPNKPKDASEVLEILMKNFDDHYMSNKAPFTVNLQNYEKWFKDYPYALEGIFRFIDRVLELDGDDVWFVSYRDMIGWMQSPTKLFTIKYFGPFDRKREMGEICEEKFSFGKIDGTAVLIIEIFVCTVAFIYFYVKEHK